MDKKEANMGCLRKRKKSYISSLFAYAQFFFYVLYKYFAANGYRFRPNWVAL
jgi:hypothetical protein